MADLSGLTNDELAQAGRDFLVETETRIAASNHPHKTKMTILVGGAHVLLQRAAKLDINSGGISANSVDTTK